MVAQHKYYGWRQQPIMTAGPWGKAVAGLLPTMHFGGFRAKGAALSHKEGLSPSCKGPHLYFSSPHNHCLHLCVDTTVFKNMDKGEAGDRGKR